MKVIQCTFCQHVVRLDTLPDLPYVECERCGMRVALNCAREETETLDQCPKCGEHIEHSIYDIHYSACTGVKHHAENQHPSSV